jgi:hypothetical protein
MNGVKTISVHFLQQLQPAPHLQSVPHLQPSLQQLVLQQAHWPDSHLHSGPHLQFSPQFLQLAPEQHLGFVPSMFLTNLYITSFWYA